jgi:hypothetical protein
VTLLLRKRDCSQPKLHAEAFLINLLVKSMPSHIENLNGRSDKTINLVL